MSLVIDARPDIGVTRVSRWIFNCYVLHGEAGLIVVDAGLPNVVSDLAPVVRDLDRPVLAVVATHGHTDHVAGASRVAERYDAPIHLPARTLAYIAGERPRTPSPVKMATIWRTLLDQPFDPAAATGLLRGAATTGYGARRSMPWPGLQPAGGLNSGDSLPGHPEWSVIAAPGHTDDSIAFWNAATGTLLTGDAAVSARGQARMTSEISPTRPPHGKPRAACGRCPSSTSCPVTADQ